MESQREGEVLTALSQGEIHLRRPVMDMKQVAQKAQLLVALL